MKCGCGIDAPASNRLYKDMQDFGLWNFTFELLEKCNNKIFPVISIIIPIYNAEKYINQCI